MSFELELALDRIDAELASELPPYVRALAAAYAGGTAPPPPPRVLGPRTITLARRALASPLAPRALELLRLGTPLALEEDRAVSIARAAAPSWPAFRALAAARDAAARTAFGAPHVSWLHWLHGTGALTPAIAAIPDEVPGWRGATAPLAIADVWDELAARHGASGRCTIVEAPVRPRTFVIDPGREAVVVIGPITTPALRFAALHELGHALAALLSPVALPRMLDEAAAAYVARALEIDGPWFTPAAGPARVRRAVLVATLDAAERGASIPLAAPPWGLWSDPAAQAAYVVAERFAETWWTRLGPAPGPGAFAAELARQRAHVEACALADRALAASMLPA